MNSKLNFLPKEIQESIARGISAYYEKDNVGYIVIGGYLECGCCSPGAKGSSYYKITNGLISSEKESSIPDLTGFIKVPYFTFSEISNLILNLRNK